MPIAVKSASARCALPLGQERDVVEGEVREARHLHHRWLQSRSRVRRIAAPREAQRQVTRLCREVGNRLLAQGRARSLSASASARRGEAAARCSRSACANTIWVRPGRAAETEYRAVTGDGLLRHAAFNDSHLRAHTCRFAAHPRSPSSSGRRRLNEVTHPHCDSGQQWPISAEVPVRHGL